jgi:hypothetical protein
MNKNVSSQKTLVTYLKSQANESNVEFEKVHKEVLDVVFNLGA